MSKIVCNLELNSNKIFFIRINITYSPQKQDVMNGSSYRSKHIDVHKQEIERAIEQKDWMRLKHIISKWQAPDIADLLREIEPDARIIIFRLLPNQLQSDVFSELDNYMQEDLLKQMKERTIKQVLMELEPDERTQVFEDLPPDLTRKLLNMLEPDERREALKLLGYPESSVGRLMTPDYIALKKHWTIQKALNHIRQWGKDAETINMVYVIDDDWKLLDDIPIRRIILADPGQSVEDIMDYHFVYVNVTADQEEAIKLFDKYDLVALPVTDNEGHLLGIVTVDDIIDALHEEQTEDFMKFSAIETKPAELDYMTRLKDIPLSKIYKSRITWLLALLVMDLITGGIIQGFENTIAKYVVLVTFLPVLVDTSGNAGSQSATLLIRALALGTVQMRDWLKLIGRELLVALALGITMGVGISIMGIVRGKSWKIAEVVVIAMIVNVVVGSLIGVVLPFIFTKLKKDPATASTPLITTLADIIGTAIYLGIATVMLS